MRGRFRVLPAVLLAAAFPLAGCGGGNSDEGQITDAIETAVTTNTPSNCTELETQRFVEQTQFASGAEALKKCRESGPERNADSADVSNVEVNGDAATADVAITGAAFDGQTLTVSLVKENDQWKLDHIDSFVSFDQQVFAEAFAKATQQGDQPASQDQANCIAGKLAAAPADTLQRAVLSGNEQAFAVLFATCFQ